MEDKNIPQAPQEPTSGQPSNSLQNSGSQTNESTYWEGLQQGIPTSEASSEGAAQPSSEPVTPEQFYEHYQQQMTDASTSGYPQPGSSQPVYPTTGMNPLPKKKSQGKLIAVLLILVLLLCGTAAAYAFQDSIRNTFALLTKSPVEYYAYVEKSSLHNTVDELKPYLNLTPKNAAYDASTDITFHREALDSIMQSTLGTSLSDIESTIGIPIENIGMDVLVGYQDGLLNETLGVRFNQVNLITLELFMDTIKQELMLRLPELSQAYLKQSLAESESIPGFSMLSPDLLTADRTAALLNRYGDILIDHITQVTLEKNTSLTLDTLSVNCSKLTITITEQDQKNIAIAILEAARSDEDILALLPMFATSIEEYQLAIDDILKELQSPDTDSASGQTMQMLVYIDSHGYIIGREFSMVGSAAAIGYTSLAEKDEQEYTFYVKDDSGNTMIEGIGNQIKDQGAFDGTITVEYSDPSSEFLSNLSFDIKYEDVRTEIVDSRIYQYGTYTFSSLDLMGLQIIMENSVDKDTQYNKIIFQMGASPLVTIDTKSNYLEDYDVVIPPETAEIYDTSQSESYIASLKIEEYLTKLSEQLGVDLNSLLGLFQTGLPIE